MALATNAEKKSYGATVNHVINGAQIASAGFSLASDIDNVFTNADGYLYVDVALTLTKAAAGTAGLTVALYIRPLNFVSTNDQPEVDANFKADFVRAKVVDAVNTEQFLLFQRIWVGGYACEFYIENLTGQTINATWDLDIMPWTYVPQA
jgi:hypothetical protein